MHRDAASTFPKPFEKPKIEKRHISESLQTTIEMNDYRQNTAQ
jgi:hypothetical protein